MFGSRCRVYDLLSGCRGGSQQQDSHTLGLALRMVGGLLALLLLDGDRHDGGAGGRGLNPHGVNATLPHHSGEIRNLKRYPLSVNRAAS